MAGLHEFPNHPMERGFIPARLSGDPVFTFYDRISRKAAASLTAEWGDDRVVAVPSDPVR